MKPITLFSLSMLAAAAMTGCSGETKDAPDKPDDPQPSKKEIRISASLDDTRVTDSSFDTNDCVGVYVSNYNGSSPSPLKNTGNHVDNMRFTYTGSWTADSPVYWKDETTPADFYLYYPYRDITSVTAVSFDTKANQSSESAYKASEFLGGKAENVPPTTGIVNIQTRHLMSRVQVVVAAGEGFTEEALAKSNVSVTINNLKTHSTIDLTNFNVTATGLGETVYPLAADGGYKALVVPQTVADCELITVTVDGQPYNLRKGFTFESGKNHKFTVTVTRGSSGINVSITGWEDDGQDNGGVAS